MIIYYLGDMYQLELISKINSNFQARDHTLSVTQTIIPNIENVTSIHYRNYTGNVDVNGNPSGQGVLTWAYGINYNGTWKNGKFNGNGTLTWNPHNKYIGEFSDGDMHGTGVLATNDMRLDGRFKRGTPNGPGNIKYFTGYKKDDVYEGDIVEGYMTGFGTYDYSDGRVYKGDIFVTFDLFCLLERNHLAFTSFSSYLFKFCNL